MRLQRRGYTTTVVARSGPLVRRLVEAGVRHVAGPVDSNRPLGWLRTTALLSRLLANGPEPAVLHAQAALPSLCCWLASRLHRGVPVITTGHGWEKHRYAAVACLLRHTSRLVIAVSEQMATDLQQAGLPGDLLRVIPNAVDVRVWKKCGGRHQYLPLSS
ncbi:MAG: glycosyltransferase family 4 protein, partial [Anaerolineae bacterium]